MNSEKRSINYDGNNNFTAWLFQIWDGSDWISDVKASFTYDGNHNITEWLGQSWDGSAWADIDRGFLQYDGNNNNTQEFQEDWNGSDWVKNWKNSFSYDGNNNLIVRLDQIWVGSDWVNDDKTSNTYDGNNNLIEDLRQDWDGSNWVAVWMGTYLYNTTGIELIEGEINTYSLSNNYPNLFNPSTKIVFQISESEFVTLKVYDILGNEIVSLLNEKIGAGKYEVEFNATNLPSGTYLYVLQAGNFTQTKKMILLK